MKMDFLKIKERKVNNYFKFTKCVNFPVVCMDESSQQLVRKVRLIMDNLNTHDVASFYEISKVTGY